LDWESIISFGIEFLIYGVIWYLLFKIQLDWNPQVSVTTTRHEDNRYEAKIYLSEHMTPVDFEQTLDKILSRYTIKDLLKKDEIYLTIAETFNQQVLEEFKQHEATPENGTGQD